MHQPNYKASVTAVVGFVFRAPAVMVLQFVLDDQSMDCSILRLSHWIKYRYRFVVNFMNVLFAAFPILEGMGKSPHGFGLFMTAEVPLCHTYDVMPPLFLYNFTKAIVESPDS